MPDAAEFLIRYTGMDQQEYAELHTGNQETLAEHVQFLEERGAQNVETEKIDW